MYQKIMSGQFDSLIEIVLDGWGKGEDNPETNAVFAAKTPNMDKFMAENPFTYIQADSEGVGLPPNTMGSSEVGHENLGAGIISLQELLKINKRIETGEFFQNERINAAMDHAVQNNSSLQLIGLLSDGGVHSHIDHLFALLELAKEKGVKDVQVHAVLDGRDVYEKSAEKYITALEDKMAQLELGRIASLSGRDYAMDRDDLWPLVQKAYDAYTAGKGLQAGTALGGLKASYENGILDEHVLPTIIGDDPNGIIKDNDSVIHFNFRPDRAKRITHALTNKEFPHLERETLPNIHYLCMTQYDEELTLPIAFPKETIPDTLPEIISRAGIKQLRMSELTKEPHVTSFFSGGLNVPFEGEDRITIKPLQKGKINLVEHPEMCAPRLADAMIEQLKKKEYGFILLNFANGDMVGHEGDLEAAIKAVEVVDYCVGNVVYMARKMGYQVIITADHGNADEMVTKNGKKSTKHSTNLVPFIPITDKNIIVKGSGVLGNVAASVATLMGLQKPARWETSLIMTENNGG